jgi:hypothetical protein
MMRLENKMITWFIWTWIAIVWINIAVLTLLFK